MKERIRIAYCYMAHNNVDYAKDILERSIQKYALHGIDIYVYDDSVDLSIYELVDSYLKRGAQNITYVDMRFVKNSDEKILAVMNGYGLNGEYDYVWPVKERVCFSDSHLDRLLFELGNGPDVVIGMDPKRRWNSDREFSRLLYDSPVDFYRDYGFYATNWEMLCFKVETLVRHTDFSIYEKIYQTEGSIPFFIFTWLFERLAEISGPQMVFCPYENDDLYICPGATSSWWDVLFSLWIDKWVAANYSLPSIYDPYKVEVIKSLTNLTDKFGSVEQMMNYHAQGLYTIEVFKKYESMWPFITEIPVEWLRLIAEDDYDSVIRLAIADFEKSLRNKNYNRAHWLMFSNQWFSRVYGEQKYYALLAALYCFYDQMIKTGHSDAFDGLETIDDIVAKYG